MLSIGYYSASTPITAFSPISFERAQKYLEKKNVHLIPGQLTGKKDFYRSVSILERALEINELIHNDQVDVIMATIGGTNTNAVLPYIDYTYLQEHPKTFVGVILTQLRCCLRLKHKHQLAASYMDLRWWLLLGSGNLLWMRHGKHLARF